MSGMIVMERHDPEGVRSPWKQRAGGRDLRIFFSV